MVKKQTLLIGLLVVLLVVPGIVLAQNRPERAWVGITITQSDEGIVITSVMPESPAASAGLEVGDVIQSVNGRDIQRVGQLLFAINRAEPGDTLTLSVKREAETLDFEVTLGNFPPEIISVAPIDGEALPRVGRSLMGLIGIVIKPTDSGWEVVQVFMPVEDGLQTGDVIIAVNGMPINELDLIDLRDIVVPARSIGLELTVLRDGEEVTVEVGPLGEMPFAVPGGNNVPDQRILLGIQYRQLSGEEATDLKIDQETGAVVVNVIPGSAAEQAGLQADDVILAVDDTDLTLENDLQSILAGYESGDTVTLKIFRDESIQEIEVTLATATLPVRPIRRSDDAPPQGRFRIGVMALVEAVLDDIDLESLPEEGSITVECTDEDGDVVLTLQLEFGEGEAMTSISVPGLGFGELFELDPDALDCTVTQDLEGETTE